MPVNTTAIVMKAEAGAELACRGHNYDLPAGDNAIPRGVVSYYATVALAVAATAGDWLARIEALVQQDIQTGRLPGFYRPNLHVLGSSEQRT